MKILYRFLAIGCIIVLLFQLISFSAVAKMVYTYVYEVLLTDTHRCIPFHSKVDITPYSQNENNALGSFASIHGSEYKIAALSDIIAQTHIANEMEDSIFHYLYTQVGYVDLEITLEAGETFYGKSVATSELEGVACAISSSSIGEYNDNDTIKYFVSTHKIYVGLVRYEVNYSGEHCNNITIRFANNAYIREK